MPDYLDLSPPRPPISPQFPSIVPLISKILLLFVLFIIANIAILICIAILIHALYSTRGIPDSLGYVILGINFLAFPAISVIISAGYFSSWREDTAKYKKEYAQYQTLITMWWPDELARRKAINSERRREENTRQQKEQARQSQKEKSQEERHDHSKSSKNTPGSIATEKQALELLEMSKPYTLEQLKKRRMELLKKVHPDQGGSNMMTRMVNDAYEFLRDKFDG